MVYDQHNQRPFDAGSRREAGEGRIDVTVFIADRNHHKPGEAGMVQLRSRVFAQVLLEIVRFHGFRRSRIATGTPVSIQMFCVSKRMVEA